MRCWTTRAVTCALLAATPGCYSYTYRLRSPSGTDNQEIAIENYPHEDVRWSSFWGASENKWSPTKDVTDRSGKHYQVPACDYGLGQVTVQYTAATFFMTVITLGMAVPMSVSAWCSTESAPKGSPATAGSTQPGATTPPVAPHVGP